MLLKTGERTNKRFQVVMESRCSTVYTTLNISIKVTCAAQVLLITEIYFVRVNANKVGIVYSDLY